MIVQESWPIRRVESQRGGASLGKGQEEIYSGIDRGKE